MYAATAEKRNAAISITTDMNSETPTLPVACSKTKNHGITDCASATPTHFMGVSRSVRGIETAPAVPASRYARRPEAIPAIRLFQRRSSAHSPPTTIAPTPR